MKPFQKYRRKGPVRNKRWVLTRLKDGFVIVSFLLQYQYEYLHFDEANNELE